MKQVKFDYVALLNFYLLNLCGDMDFFAFLVLSMNVWCTCL